MPPEPNIQISWSIIKAPVVIELLKGAAATFRDGMINVIDGLQSNPRPPEAIAEKIGDSITFRIAIDSVDPASYLVYSIDEVKERVVITGIMRKYFS